MSSGTQRPRQQCPGGKAPQNLVFEEAIGADYLAVAFQSFPAHLLPPLARLPTDEPYVRTAGSFPCTTTVAAAC
jgi:hypothetical protein